MNISEVQTVKQNVINEIKASCQRMKDALDSSGVDIDDEKAGDCYSILDSIGDELRNLEKCDLSPTEEEEEEEEEEDVEESPEDDATLPG